MVDPEIRNLLKDEYLHIQKTIVELDGRIVSIKTWTVSFSLVALTSGFVAHADIVFLIASFSALLFFIIECFWKMIQKGFYFRSYFIEAYFAGKNDEITPFQIDNFWLKYYESITLRDHLKNSFRFHVLLPHIAIFILGIILFALCKMHYLKI